MEFPRLGAESELQLLAYATATATQDPSQVCDLHHSSQQCQILNPLSKARDRTCNLMVPSRICFHCATTGTPNFGGLWRIEVVAICLVPGPGMIEAEEYCLLGPKRGAVAPEQKAKCRLASGGAVSPQPESFLKMSKLHNIQKIIICTGRPQRSCGFGSRPP